MYRIYSAGDLFAFPGFEESLGMVYLEAQSCGVPVVAMADGGIPEVVANGETGLLTEEGDVDGQAAALVRMATTPGLIDRMGQAMAKHVAHQFQQDGCLAQLVRHYREAVA